VISVEIQNTSNVIWQSSGTRPVQLSYHWYSEGGEPVALDGLRTRLAADVRPGETVTVRAVLRAPDMPGKMQLVWDLVQEHVLWFSKHDPLSIASCWVDIS